jgi:hypothetical protein
MIEVLAMHKVTVLLQALAQVYGMPNVLGAAAAHENVNAGDLGKIPAPLDAWILFKIRFALCRYS